MIKSTLFAGLTSIALLTSPAFAASASEAGLEPAINGSVSSTGTFPNQAMEDAFKSYLSWTEEKDLSRLVAFELLIDDNQNARALPTREMQEQFTAYMNWTKTNNISPFHAFIATDGNQ